MNLIVCLTSGQEFHFEGDEANKVYGYIDDAGARGAGWTVPIKLNNGYEMIFVLDNITTIQFKGE